MRRTGFLDEAHAAMHLNAHRGHIHARIGAEGLGDGRQQGRPRLPVGRSRGAGHVDGHGTGERDGAGRKHLGLHGGQHSAHIGMVHDRARATLHPTHRIADRRLCRRIGHADALYAHGQAGVVHHREHGRHALVRGAHHPAGCAAILHHCGGRAVQAQLVLQADDLQRVALPRVACGIGYEFRDQEQADSPGAFGGVGQAGQHQMTGVRCEIIVGPGDVDLLAGDGIGAVRLRLCPGAQRAHIAAGLGFGQVHGSQPFARNQARQVQRLDRIAGMMLQRLDLALCQQVAQMKRDAGPRHHVIHRRGQSDRQPHPAELRIGRNGKPAAFGHGAIPLGKARRGAHDAVVQPGGVRVAHALQGGQHLFRKAGRPGEDRLDRVIGRLGEAVGRGNAGKPGHMGQQEAEIGNWGAVGHWQLRVPWQGAGAGVWVSLRRR